MVTAGWRLQALGAAVVAERLEGLLRVPDTEDVLGRTRRERRVVGGVVGRLRDDGGILADLEDAALSGGLGKDGLEVPQRDVGVGVVSAVSHLDLHDRPGVGPVAWLRVGRAAAVHQVPVSGVVVVRRGAGRDRRRGVVVEDQGLARVGAEVNDDVRALRRHEEQRVLVDDAEIEVGRVEVVPDRLLRDHDRRRREATLGADLDPRRSCRCRIGNAARRVGILVCRGDTDRDHLDLGAVGHRPRLPSQRRAGVAT